MVNKTVKLIRAAWQHQGLRKYGANTIWLFSEKIIRMLIGFTVGVYVARQLGPSKYGLLNYAISFCAIFSFISSLGLDSIVVRELVKFPENKDELLGTTFWLKAIGVLLMLGLVCAGAFLSKNDVQTNILVLIIAAGYLFQTFQTIDFYFQAQVMSKYIAISQVVAWTLVSAGRVFFAYTGAPLMYFAVLEAANMALMSFGYLFFYIIKVSHPFHWKFKFDTAKGLLKDSWPLLLSGAAGMIYMRIDQVMIKEMLGNASNGQYAVAIRLCEIFNFLPILTCSSFFPAIIRAKKVSNKHFEHRMQLLYEAMLSLSFAIAIPIALLAQPIVLILFGKPYQGAISIVIIYIWRLPFVALGTAAGKWMIVKKLQIYSFVFVAFGAIANIVLNYFLIKALGLSGCAIATIVASVLFVVIAPFLFHKTRFASIQILKAFLFIETLHKIRRL
ncbi:flippase [Lentisphaerota bacterium ZTH]|nr:flippase [Lentisphaerota bacterium]WET06407.1 flippase [Lentisphaerota bacterium ZTH]